jgi:hypothetical protein
MTAARRPFLRTRERARQRRWEGPACDRIDWPESSPCWRQSSCWPWRLPRGSTGPTCLRCDRRQRPKRRLRAMRKVPRSLPVLTRTERRGMGPKNPARRPVLDRRTRPWNPAGPSRPREALDALRPGTWTPRSALITRMSSSTSTTATTGTNGEVAGAASFEAPRPRGIRMTFRKEGTLARMRASRDVSVLGRCGRPEEGSVAYRQVIRKHETGSWNRSQTSARLTRRVRALPPRTPRSGP